MATQREHVSLEEALERIQSSWDRLMVTMTRASEEEYETKRDAAGWTPVDHLAHVMAWERSRRGWLLGLPRYEGLGVTEEEFGGDIDQLNETVRQQTAGKSYQQVMELAIGSHQQLIDVIQSYDSLRYETLEGTTPEEIENLGALLVEHLADHYDEHREYIERILDAPDDNGNDIEGLIDRIEAAWSELMSTMLAYPEVATTAKRDANGWTALDHMAHVTAWERSWTAFLQGEPRHVGLGVTEQEFSMDYDSLNEILRARTANDSFEEVMTAAREGHEALIDALRNADLDRLDYETQGGRQIDVLLTENVIDHYNEHREYIEKILSA